MDVLIVSLNRLQEPVPVLPVGACVAAEVAEGAGHSVRLLDLMFERSPRRALRDELRRRRPDVVGLSLRNLDNAEWADPVSFLPELQAAVAEARSAGARVVLGGAAVGVAAEALLRHTGADGAVAGDAEGAFPALLESLSGTARPEERVIRANTANGVGFPRLERWLRLGAYAARFATIPLQSKRGCPFGCVYCTYPQIEGPQYRLRSPEDVAAEVSRLAGAGVRDVEFVDNVFNAPRDHAFAICEELARRRPGAGVAARLHSVDLTPQFLDGDLLDAMERAGFAGAGLTVESAADPVLQRLGKGFGAEAVHRAAELLRARRLPCLWIFLLGGPGETEATAAETLRFAATRLGPGDAAFLSVGLRIYPGTALEGIARQEGVLPDAPGDLLAPAFYLSPQLDPARLLQMVRNAVARNPGFIGPGMGLRWTLPAVRRIGYALGLRPPLWRHAGRLRRLAPLPAGRP